MQIVESENYDETFDEETFFMAKKPQKKYKTKWREIETIIDNNRLRQEIMDLNDYPLH